MPTYDDITRKTVPDPDGSMRPSPEQVKAAYEGFRAMDADEQALAARVRAALSGHDVQIEVERDQVTVSGTVDAAAARAIPDKVRGVDGVGSVVDRLVQR